MYQFIDLFLDSHHQLLVLAAIDFRHNTSLNDVVEIGFFPQRCRFSIEIGYDYDRHCP